MALTFNQNSGKQVGGISLPDEQLTIERASENPKVAADITDKRGYANRWQISVRTCDNWLASGMPHLKLSPRRVRICVSEADQWMREQFCVRRIGKENAR